MLKVPEIFKGEENFWEWNPQYILIFKDFYDADKTKNRMRSSRIMWGIYFLVHPKSDLYNLPNKKELISKNYLKDENFKWETVDGEQDLFIHSILTQAERSLYNWDTYMMKRDAYLKSLNYYFDEYLTDENGDNVVTRTGQFVTIKGTAEQLDKAYSITPKMYAEYEKIKKSLSEEDIKRGRGNKPMSLSETGEL